MTGGASARRAWLLTCGIVVATVAAGWLLLGGSSSMCKDPQSVVAASASNFHGIRGTLLDRTEGQWTSSATIDDATDCSLFIDPERALHLCEWQYAASSGVAQSEYEKSVRQVQSCLNDAAIDRQDTSVNHPDFWASTYFGIPEGEVNVALKNKQQLGLVFVTIGVDTLLATAAS